MGFDDTDINPGLVLGLGLSNQLKHPTATAVVNPELLQPFNNLEPSLVLSLSSGEPYDKKVVKDLDDNLYRQDSVASSISHVTVKRERGDEEDEEDEDGGSNAAAGKKLRLTKAQSAMLEESFTHRNALNPKQKQELAKELHLRPRQVEVWFQNRRARTKLKQTEVDCEFLKKCCETLTEENRRLQKELQELKALKVANPFYNMQPAATGICPSCERIVGVVAGEKTSKSSLIKTAPKHHLLNNNPFANQSAAC